MQKARLLALLALFFLLGCAPTNPTTSNGLPAAATPVLVILTASVPAPVQGPSPSWVPTPLLAANFSGEFRILPLRSPQSNIKLELDAPYPSTLSVTGSDPAAGTVTSFAQIPSGQAAPSAASFSVDNVDVERTPARWTINLRLPPEPFTRYTISISDISGNPVFTGTSRESEPLVLPLGPSWTSFTVKVTIVGPGHVTSSPGGISCDQNTGTCSYYFVGAPQPIALNPGSGSQSKFLGWTGNCVGRNICYLAQTGLQDFAVVANFVPQTDTSTGLPNCPVAPALAGWTWKGPPSCGGLAHPSTADGTTHCDAQGYFCCDPGAGTDSSGCLTGEHRSSPDCGTGTEAGIHLKLFQPGGCYETSSEP